MVISRLKLSSARNSPLPGPIAAFAVATMLAAPALARAAERITLANGFEIDCARREPADGGRTRLFLLPSSSSSQSEASYIDVASSAVVRVETIPDPPVIPEPKTPATALPATKPTPADIHAILAHAGAQHHIDEDLLASVVKAESGGNVFAVSRTA
jgi:soluble lytic murein transglycosylase-like protein